MRYRKKPVVIEAVQYDGNFRCLDIFSINDVGKFIVGTDDKGNPCLKIPTLEGVMIASKGDYIIRGVKGEYYPCKPDIFEMTYDRDEPTIIQEPIKNYDAWDEVINQLGDTNEMIDHIGGVNEMVDHVPDGGKMVENDIEKLAEQEYREFPHNPKDKPDWHYNRDVHCFKKRKAFIKGYNKAKETLYTEEQMRMAFEYGKGVGELELKDEFEQYIQSLKQPKQ